MCMTTFCFKKNVSGNSSHVIVTEEESFGERKQKKKYVQDKQSNNKQTKRIQAVVS